MSTYDTLNINLTKFLGTFCNYHFSKRYNYDGYYSRNVIRTEGLRKLLYYLVRDINQVTRVNPERKNRDIN